MMTELPIIITTLLTITISSIDNGPFPWPEELSGYGVESSFDDGDGVESSKCMTMHNYMYIFAIAAT